MIDTKHKIVLNPVTFDPILIEISYPPYKKRVVDPNELRHWCEYRFRNHMEYYGYGGPALDAYIERWQPKFNHERWDLDIPEELL